MIKHLFILFLIVLFTSCDNLELLNEQPKSNKSRLHFNYSQESRNTSASLPNEVFYVNILNSTYNYTSLNSGDNTIELDRDGIYIFTMVNRNPDSTTPINVVGSISILETGGNSIPVSEEAESDIDLGTLIIDNGEFGSTISSSDFAIKTGYDPQTIYSLGNYDNVLLKFANPDINRNGIYDFEEGLNWLFTSGNTVNLTFEDVDKETLTYKKGLVELKASISSPEFIFWFSDYYNYQPIDSVKLYKPDGSFLEVSHTETEQDNTRKYYFNFDTSSFQEGTYIVDMNGTKLFLDNVSFYDASNGDLNGFIFPMINVEDDGTNITKYQWKWYQVSNGIITPANKAENELKISDFYFYGNRTDLLDPYFIVEPDQHFGIDFYSDGEVILPTDIMIPKADDYYICSYWDYAFNNVSFVFNK